MHPDCDEAATASVDGSHEGRRRAGAGPLVGTKVVEFAQVIAGPLCGTLLADLGADVVHVENPKGGDSARKMGPQKDGQYLWWKVLGRNKRAVTLDLNHELSRGPVEELIKWADIVIVTFRAETAERYGVDWHTVCRLNPHAIMVQISGYGEATTRRNEPGFGKVGEARSGVAHLSGYPDGPPIFTGFSHGDSTTALMAAFSATTALARRNSDPARRGDWIDIALDETLFRLIEWQVIVHDQLQMTPARVGNSLAVAPAAVINTYRTASKDWITVTSATPRSVENIVRLLGLDGDASHGSQAGASSELLDRELEAWIADRETSNAVDSLREAGVVASKVYDIGDIFADDVYRERNSIVDVEDEDLGSVKMQGVVPRFRLRPGVVWRTGPKLGEDNQEVYGDWLGISPEQIEALTKNEVI